MTDQADMEEKIAAATAAHFHKRAVDELAHCHQRHRDSSLTRWVVGAFCTLMVSLLGFFALENYNMVNDRINDQRQLTTALQRDINSHQQAITEMQANQRNMLDTLARTEKKLDAVLERFHVHSAGKE